MPLVAVADELYALAPEEFTAARNARAKAAQADGDRDLAAAIRGPGQADRGRLAGQPAGPPRPGARWSRCSSSAPLCGTRRRALDGAEMRALSRQQPKVVAGLVQRAAELGTPSGKPVSAGVAHDLEDTLRAAIADADAADQLMAGRLANGLQHNGFGLVAPGNLSLVATSAGPADADQQGRRRPAAGPDRSPGAKPRRPATSAGPSSWPRPSAISTTPRPPSR